MKQPSNERTLFYITWKWEYLRRNDAFKQFFNSKLEELHKLRCDFLANPSLKLPEGEGGVTGSWRRGIHEVNGRQEASDERFAWVICECEQYPAWIEISESGEVLYGPYLVGRRFQCKGIAVDDCKCGGTPDEPKEISASAVSDSVVVKDYPKGKEHETLVTIKLKRPIDEIMLDIRHLQTLWNSSPVGNTIESLAQQFIPDAAGFQATQGLKRAVGCWLFDYCAEHSCGGPTAINVLSTEYDLNRLGIGGADFSRDLKRLLARTRECVGQAEVLPLS
jgi:hypothetical protein